MYRKRIDQFYNFQNKLRFGTENVFRFMILIYGLMSREMLIHVNFGRVFHVRDNKLRT